MYDLGLKAILRLCEDQHPLRWHRAKLLPDLFKADEKPVFEWANDHVLKHHALPQVVTLRQQFPQMKEVEAPEPATYYLSLLENRFAYETLNRANIESQGYLKADKGMVETAAEVLRAALARITEQKYRTRIMDVGLEAPKALIQAYHHAGSLEGVADFGWPYLDGITNGAQGGDFISIVGRPAAGKTFLVLKGAVYNWRKARTAMVVSMEMAPMAMCQRVGAMYTGVPISQLKAAAFASKTYKKFTDSLFEMPTEKGKLYVVDGNLAADPEDVYMLANLLKVDALWVDGAYLMKNKNRKMDRYTRVAENAEAMKQHTGDLGIPTIASYQFSREASKKKKGNDKVGLEDIAYSDVIGQVSSIVLGLFQEDGVETMLRRKVDVMKGRSGEIGSFYINWLFDTMNFDQVQEEGESEDPKDDYQQYL